MNLWSSKDSEFNYMNLKKNIYPTMAHEIFGVADNFTDKQSFIRIAFEE